MSEKTFRIGAPSLAGEDATIKSFAAEKFPLKAHVKNLMPCAACFPEIEGFHLKHVAAPSGQEKDLTITDHAALCRVASSIRQICALNGYAAGIEFRISLPDAPTPEAKEPAPADDAAAAAKTKAVKARAAKKENA